MKTDISGSGRYDKVKTANEGGLKGKENRKFRRGGMESHHS
jgi:hypothetical protein